MPILPLKRGYNWSSGQEDELFHQEMMFNNGPANAKQQKMMETEDTEFSGVHHNPQIHPPNINEKSSFMIGLDVHSLPQENNPYPLMDSSLSQINTNQSVLHRSNNVFTNYGNLSVQNLSQPHTQMPASMQPVMHDQQQPQPMQLATMQPATPLVTPPATQAAVPAPQTHSICPECAAGKPGHITHIGRWKLMDL